MRSQPQNVTDLASELAQRLPEALIGERVIPRFVDSYVVENGRHALQAHASQYRDRLALLQREALLALTVQALAAACFEPAASKKSKPRPMSQKDVAIFRRKFLSALARQQKWSVGDALDFQTDLQIYENLIRRNSATPRTRKSFEVANHPFVDRSAFLLDSSFMEKARIAASRALSDLEDLTTHVVASAGPQKSVAKSR
ncbi:MAG TPA: hypothetical protein VN037_04310 [Verrucomicrobiae bacterium]|jgi:hypothetical protein|nr:hypothetical protein [Verrucomicrobiae bacterium]